VIGGTPNASNAASPLLDGTYFFTPNLAVNLIAATTRHQVEVRNSALGTVNLGSVWALPPTLTAQYHLLPQSRISPYVGVGLNTTFFYGYGGNPTAGQPRAAGSEPSASRPISAWITRSRPIGCSTSMPSGS
jgi:outer membrane protein